MNFAVLNNHDYLVAASEDADEQLSIEYGPTRYSSGLLRMVVRDFSIT
jgi:hypothetical protein